MNYYNEIKNKLIDNKVYKKVKDYSKNRNDLSTYYEVGKLLIKAQGGEERAKYGDNLIKEYSERLFNDTDRKYNITALKRIRQFYLVVEKGVPLAHQLTWSHYCELLPLKDINEINYYVKITIEQCLSKRQLRERIKNKEYQRLDDKTKLKLINKEEIDIKDNIKNPIIIKNKLDIDKEIVSEKILQRLILEDIPSFLEELGTGYSFIKNEYKIKLGVDSKIIDKYTVYSIETADEMSKVISNYTNSNYGVGITGKLSRPDINNPYGEDNLVFISIYNKDNNKYYHKEIKVDKITREENKNIVIEEIITMLINIIN